MRISDLLVGGRCGSIVCQDWTLSNSSSWRNWSANCWRIRGTRERPATELTLREALIVASGYVRNNITEEIWAQIFDVDQSTISRYITFLTPLTGKAAAGVPAIRGGGSKLPGGAIALVGGTLWPCWCRAGEHELGPGNTGQRAADR